MPNSIPTSHRFNGNRSKHSSGSPRWASVLCCERCKERAYGLDIYVPPGTKFAFTLCVKFDVFDSDKTIYQTWNTPGKSVLHSISMSTCEEVSWHLV